jgi:hypothetical protein
MSLEGRSQTSKDQIRVKFFKGMAEPDLKIKSLWTILVTATKIIILCGRIVKWAMRIQYTNINIAQLQNSRYFKVGGPNQPKQKRKEKKKDKCSTDKM